ncbi:MAG: substrate-binding domain-containing protein [Bryobacteraceae bacterium]|nr:substrate-binding domain-containing protein [Bryobacterales bacterium]NUM99905.1 substrate-binding domain-containing protein [Bryobacteraceae bacterium]
MWRELLKRGVAVPREMSLYGFGDREEFSILEPPLTTVSVFQKKLGASMASMLLRRLALAGRTHPPAELPVQAGGARFLRTHQRHSAQGLLRQLRRQHPGPHGLSLAPDLLV